MAVFMLDTDVVSSSADSFKEIAKRFYTLANSVADYDTDSSDFNFSSVKSLIVNNINACGIKASNTACYINRVVDGHMELQRKEKYQETPFTDPGNGGGVQPTTPRPTKPTTPPGTVTVYTTNPPIDLYYRPVATAVVVSSGIAASTVVSASYQEEKPKEEEKETVEDKEEQDESSSDNEPKVIKVKVEKVTHGEVERDSLNSAGRFMFDHDAFKYNESGYATVGDKYVISCGSGFGNVGDEIEFKLKDGSVVRCIIGQISERENSVKFFVNDKWSEKGANNLPINFADSILKIRNMGFNDNYSIRPSVCSALDWAYDLANGNTSTGDYDDYIELNRFGYSSFALSSYKSAGVVIDEKEGEDIQDTLVEAGFEKLENNMIMAELKPGDLLIDENGRFVMYYGDGKIVEEYGDVTGASSDFGVRLSDYTDHQWNGILRYSGNKISKTSTNNQIDTDLWREVN